MSFGSRLPPTNMQSSLPVGNNDTNHPALLESSLATPGVKRRDSVVHDSNSTNPEPIECDIENEEPSDVTNNPKRIQLTQTRIILHSDDLASLPIVQFVHVEQIHLHQQSSVPALIEIHSSFIPKGTSPTQPIHPSHCNPGSLNRGPAAYVYTPLSTRTQAYESLRYDHGVRFRRRLALTEVVLHWMLLCDEDAAPNMYRERVIEFFKSRLGTKKARKARKARKKQLDEEEDVVVEVEVSAGDRKKRRVFGKVKKWVGRKLEKFRKGR